jgi:hypothetical protein
VRVLHLCWQGFLDFIHSQGVPSGYFGTAGADYSNIKAAEMICDVFHNGGTEADIPFLGYDATATLTITGKVIRAAGRGLIRVDETKTAAGGRTLPLPSFAVTVLSARRSLPYLGQQTMVFPSTAGTWRDPETTSAPAGGRCGAGSVSPMSRLTASASRGHADRRRGTVGTDRRRPPGPRQDQHDAGQVHGPRPHAHCGGGHAGPHHKRRISGDSEPSMLKNSL